MKHFLLISLSSLVLSSPVFAETKAETKYISFQVQTGLYGYASQFHPAPGHFALSKAQMEEFVHSVVGAIGATGDARNKLAFAVGPLCFDMSDEETRQFIQDAFAVARENDVAVAFHIDDSMGWGTRKDLISNPDNLETADWKQVPNTGRRMDWGRTPTKFAPQMCFNSPAIQAAVKARAALIGTEVKKEIDALKTSGKEYLLAGVFAGWETQIGRDFDTDRPLGYRALSHRGFSETNPPKEPDLERVAVVKEFIELWANSLHAAGIPQEKLFCHIAFTAQGLRAPDARESYAVKVHFAPSEVAFSSAYRPGFSTYPEGSTFKEVYAALAQHGSPGWISAEGVNVSPTGMPGEPTMETYLGRMFNHGAVLTNIYSWGMGGEAMRNNFFRQATESPEALAAYNKFLRGEPLVETVATGFSSEKFQDKMHRIQSELPAWVQKSGQQAQAMPLIEKIKALMKDRQFQEADKVADEILSLISPGEHSSPAPSVESKAPATSEQPQYLLFWNLPEKAGELVERVGMKGDGTTRLLAFGLPLQPFEFEEQLPTLIRRAFTAAREQDLAVMLSFDLNVAWKKRPDLWNWFDPSKPGYNADNKYNVEWHGWDGPPNKASYLNWGVLERRPPQLCFTSKKVRAEVTRLVAKIIGPILREEVAKLNADGKGILFAGVLVGSEPVIDDYSKPGPERMKMMQEDGVPVGPLGYRALLDRGFSAAHPPADFRGALADITHETISFWCQQFVDAGIPAEKLYTHVVAPAPFAMTNARIWTAFNDYSRPGWTTYSVSALRESFKPIYDELEKHGNPAWAGVEANAGVPGSVVDWETYLAWHYNHGCVLMGVNTGAGKEVEQRLWDSAFGNEALAAYHKFLTGQPLIEKPFSLDNPQLRIQAKIKRVAEGIHRWQSSGKDPSPVGKLMEGAQPLIKAGNLVELEKLADQALEMLGETEKAPEVYRPK